MTSEGMGETFGAYVKRLRQERGQSLRDIERAMGGAFSNAYISKVENGKVANPSVKFVLFLAASLGLDSVDLVHRVAHDNQPPPTPSICPTCGRVW